MVPLGWLGVSRPWSLKRWEKRGERRTHNMKTAMLRRIKGQLKRPIRLYI